MCDAKDIASFSAYLYKNRYCSKVEKNRVQKFRTDSQHGQKKTLDISEYLEGI